MTQAVHSHKETTVSYYMFAKKNSQTQNKEYFVCVTSQKDCTCVSLGSDHRVATEIYHTLSGGRVTPCTVWDILQDLDVYFQPCAVVAQESFVLSDAEQAANLSEREEKQVCHQPLNC